jgi:hypothetical protein
MKNEEWRMKNGERRMEDGRGQNDQASQEGQRQEQGSNGGIGRAGGFQNSLLQRIEFGEFVMEPL